MSQKQYLKVLQCTECGLFYANGKCLPKDTIDEDVIDFFKSYRIEFDDCMCNKCIKIHDIKINNVMEFLKNLMDRNFVEENENVLMDIWDTYVKPDGNMCAYKLSRKDFDNHEDELMCPCDGPFIECGSKNDVSKYQCLNCGTITWIA